MTLSKNLKLGAFALSLVGVLGACSSDDDATTIPNNGGSLKIAASANYGSATPATQAVTVNDANDSVSLNSFYVNFQEIELEFEDEEDLDSLDNIYGSDDEIELEGPFEYDLLSDENFPVVDIDVPNGVLEELEFEFDQNEDSDSELYGKSMEMKGEISGQEFVFWHNFEDEIEVDFEDADNNLNIDNNDNEVIINFALDAVFSNSGVIDLSTATDDNDDGVITISPEDTDGNNALADAIKEAIKAKIELIDD